MKKLLIANRGEIAIRIARAARDYGAVSVGIYSDVDANGLHVQVVDEAYGLGAGRSIDTYLNIERIIAIAKASGADAIHPGYGFLSERAEFAEAVIDAGLVWVGPAPDVIRALGDKVEARRIAAKVGAPLVKGSDGAIESAAEAVAFAKEVGLPIAIKAAFGGGGRGMKVARSIDEVGSLFDSAVREAVEGFGRGECYVEQFLDKPRHIEAQVIGDKHGKVVVLGTRDCSLQRRNQKLVEEAPAPFITQAQRQSIHDAARAICEEASYTGAGTVEFLLSRDGILSFLEVNTRLQVEHPVTEETAGIDIVIEQLRIADGLPLSISETPVAQGHAFEFRINAEDPARGFLPTPGKITYFRPPAGIGVRLDSGVETGSLIPSLYDSMMAKLIVTGKTREDALVRARRALAEFTIEGVASVLPFHRAIVDNEAFCGSDEFGVYTTWIDTEFHDLVPGARVPPADQQDLIRSFIEIDGKRHSLGLPSNLFAHAIMAPGMETIVPTDDPGTVTAPIQGVLRNWLVEDGQIVATGEAVALIEAMKMETRVTVMEAGRLTQKVAVGAMVEHGATIASVTK